MPQGVRIDLTGRVFDRLTVLGFADKRGRKLYWNCRCSCGTVKSVHGDHLKSGATQSCATPKQQAENRVWGRFKAAVAA